MTNARVSPYNRCPDMPRQNRNPAKPTTPAARSLPVCFRTLAMAEKAIINPMMGKTR